MRIWNMRCYAHMYKLPSYVKLILAKSGFEYLRKVIQIQQLTGGDLICDLGTLLHWQISQWPYIWQSTNEQLKTGSAREHSKQGNFKRS